MTNAKAEKVVILDRDGTIVADRNYLGDPMGLEFLPGAVQGLQKMRALGCRLLIITNQSGIGRGVLSVQQVQAVNARLERMMAEIGAPALATYFCPHAPVENCACRKPASGLLLKAAHDFDFQPAAAVVIGDKLTDVEFGQRVGAGTIFVRGGHELPDEVKPNFIVSNLFEAAKIIESVGAS